MRRLAEHWWIPGLIILATWSQEISAKNWNNFHISDSEALRGDRINEQGFLSGGIRINYAPRMDFRFFMDEDANADPGGWEPTLKVSQGIRLRKNYTDETMCRPGVRPLSSGKLIGFAKNSIADQSNTLFALPIGDKFCREAGYDGMVDDLSRTDLFDMLDLMDYLPLIISPPYYHAKVFFKSSGTGLFWCNGECELFFKYPHIGRAAQAPIDMYHSPPETLYKLELVQIGAIEKKFIVSSRNASLAPICMKTPDIQAGSNEAYREHMRFMDANSSIASGFANKFSRAGSPNYILEGKSQTSGQFNVSLRMPQIPALKRGSIHFQAFCLADPVALGPNATSRDNTCDIGIDLMNSYDLQPARELATFSGEVISNSSWTRKILPFPAQTQGGHIQLKGMVHGQDGTIGLDDFRLTTSQYCIPRWIKVPNMKMNLEKVAEIQEPWDGFEFTSADQETLDKKHSLFRSRGNFDLESCARLCWLGTACDMFEHDSLRGVCRLAPHTGYKGVYWSKFTEEDKVFDGTAIFILECSEALETAVAPNMEMAEYPWLKASIETTGFLDQGKVIYDDLISPTVMSPGAQEALRLMSNGTSTLSLHLPVTLPKLDPSYWTSAPSLVGVFILELRISSTIEPLVFELHHGAAVLDSFQVFNTDQLQRFTSIIPNMASANDTTLTLILTTTVANNETVVDISNLDLITDVPIYVGCFVHPETTPFKTFEDNLDHGTCLATCQAMDPALRYAALRNGTDCACLASLMALKGRPDDNCNVVCSGNPDEICGSQNLSSVWIGACPVGMVRFEEQCYFQALPSPNTIEANEDECADKDSNLMWPDSDLAIRFLRNHFGTTNPYHVGYRKFRKWEGVLHSDHSRGVAIPYISAMNGRWIDLPDITTNLMTKHSCFLLDWSNLSQPLIHASPCPVALGICMTKLAQGYGHSSLAQDLDINHQSTVLSKTPQPFLASGHLHYHFIMDHYVMRKFLLLDLHTPIVLKGLLIQTPRDKYLKTFRLQYSRQSLLKPDVLEFVQFNQEPLTFQVFEGDPASLSPVVSRLVNLPDPIETRRLRLTFLESAPEVNLKLDLIGMLSQDRYDLNPFLDHIDYSEDQTNHYITNNNSWIVTDRTISLGGSVLFRGILGNKASFKRTESRTNQTVAVFILRDTKGNPLKMEFKVNHLTSRLFLILTNEIGSYKREVLMGPFRNNPTFLSSLEVFVRCQSNGYRVFVNGDPVGLYKDVIVNGIIPQIAYIQWYLKQYYGNTTRIALTEVKASGFGNNFGRKHFTTQITDENPRSLFTFASDVPLKEESGLLQISEREMKPKQFDIGYIPFAIHQHCYHGVAGNVRCFPNFGRHSQEGRIQSGFGGGPWGQGKLKCPYGYRYLGTDCIRFPIRYPVSHFEARMTCRKEGNMVFFPKDRIAVVLLRESLKHLFTTQKVGHLWVGVKRIGGIWRTSNGKILTRHFSDWAPNQPSPFGDCAMADIALGFKWRAVHCAFPFHFMCSLRVPNCPPGYEFDSKVRHMTHLNSRACFKVAAPASYNLTDALDQRHSSISIADEICRREGTRLAGPRNQEELTRLHEFMRSTTQWMGPNPGHTTLWTGYRGTENQVVMRANSYAPIKPWLLSNGRTMYDMNVTAFGPYCYQMAFKARVGLEHTLCTVERPGLVDETEPEVLALCQSEECKSIDEEYCIFPFKFKGREYDTCISLGNSETPWCSTGTDANGHHLEGYDKACERTCNVNDCPLGFYRNYPDRTCYQVSSNNPDDAAVETFDQAQAICNGQGARLWEPRTNHGVLMLSTTDLDSGHFDWSNDAFTALGLKMVFKGGTWSMNYRSDDVSVSQTIIDRLPWAPGYPLVDPIKTCVALKKQMLQNVACSGFVSSKLLGHICEAKPMTTQAGFSSCVFPFDYHDGTSVKTSEACSHDYHIVGSNYVPWCATQVNSIGIMDDWGLCPDERQVIYDGGAEGQLCNVPFRMDGQIYEACTKKMRAPNGTFYTLDRYWCPSEDSLNETSLEWFGDASNQSSFGFCTDYNFPPDQTGCPDYYDPIGEYCVRVSAVPETHDQAQARCESEGAQLAFIPDQEFQESLGWLIMDKRSKLSYFGNVRQLWLGGAAGGSAKTWKWLGSVKPMSNFVNWALGIKDFGCPKSGCQGGHGMSMRLSLPFEWEARNKSESLPYICMSECPKGFKWLPAVQSCVAVLNNGSQSLMANMLECSKRQGKPLSVPSCSKLDLLQRDLMEGGFPAQALYFLGFFAFGLENATDRRRSALNDVKVDGLGYASHLDVANGAGLCDKMQDTDSAPNPAIPHIFSLLLTPNATMTGHLPLSLSTISSSSGSLVCEVEGHWGCPEGYTRTQEDCVRVVLEKRSQIEAEILCEAEGATLARPQTIPDVGLLFELASTKHEALMTSANLRFETAPRFWLGFNLQSKMEPFPFELINANAPFPGCVCHDDGLFTITPPGTTQVGERCYMRDIYRRNYTDAQANCEAFNMNLATFESWEKYNEVRQITDNLGDNLYIGATNPGEEICIDGVACHEKFFWLRNISSPIAFDGSWNTAEFSANEGLACMEMLGQSNGHLDDVNCTTPNPSLCQFECPNGLDHTHPPTCVSLERAIQGDHPTLTRTPCPQENYFICQKDQSLNTQLVANLPQPKSVFPLVRSVGSSDIKGLAKSLNVRLAFNAKLVPPTGMAGSVAWAEDSRLELLMSSTGLQGHKMSILVWIKPTNGSLAGIRLIAGLWYPMARLFLNDGVLFVEFPDENGASLSHGFGKALIPDAWQFIAFTYNAEAMTTQLLVGEQLSRRHHNATLQNILPGDPFFTLTLGQSPEFGPGFQGSMSCLQIYQEDLHPSQIHLVKNCSKVTLSRALQEESHCRDDYVYYDGLCFKVWSEMDTFLGGELRCLPQPGQAHVSHLIFSEWNLHLEFASTLTFGLFGRHDFWFGLDRRSGEFESSLGRRNISNLDHLWKSPANPVGQCTINHQKRGGVISTSNCKVTRPVVCVKAPFYTPPNNPCPDAYIWYKGRCFHPQKERLSFDEAQEGCARSGGTLATIKSEVEKNFLVGFAEQNFNSDAWVGVRAFNRLGQYDDSDPERIPLIQPTIKNKVHADGSPYDTSDAGYHLGLNLGSAWRGPCLYMRSVNGYEIRDMTCSKSYFSVCQWREPACPTGFERIPGMNDGRSCFGIGTPTHFGQDMCTATDNDLSRPVVPITVIEAQKILQLPNGNGEAWLGGMVARDQLWRPVYDAEAFNDPRPNRNTSLMKGLELNGSFLDLFDFTLMSDKACTKLGENGLIGIAYDLDCDTLKPPICESRACMTKQGHQCVFPFTYFNTSLDGTVTPITYTRCATLDIHRAWCPTTLDPLGQIVAWDECLDDCPFEEPEVVCVKDPPSPSLIFEHGVEVNFSSNFDSNQGLLAKELDFVYFRCPEGYVFNDTFSHEVFAYCVNWNWLIDFDVETFCTPIECPCPRWFPANTWAGTSNWSSVDLASCSDCDCPSAENRTRDYLVEVEYMCPQGFVLNTSALDYLDTFPERMNFKCDLAGDWTPNIQPHCIPKNCTQDPPIVANYPKGAFDWNLEVRNKSFLHEIKYWCPDSHWGYPSNGLNETKTVCQDDGQWSLSSLEECKYLPCRAQPPQAPKGGERLYGLKSTRYRCPEGFKFQDGSFPFFWNQCLPSGYWKFHRSLPTCVRRHCTNPPPNHFLHQDLDWPLQSRQMSVKVTYTCPFTKATVKGLTEQWSHCIWDKDTDELSWFPTKIDPCNVQVHTLDDFLNTMRFLAHVLPLLAWLALTLATRDEPSAFHECMAHCPVTYNIYPICGTDRNNYGNRAMLACQNRCAGTSIVQAYFGKCRKTHPDED